MRIRTKNRARMENIEQLGWFTLISSNKAVFAKVNCAIGFFLKCMVLLHANISRETDVIYKVFKNCRLKSEKNR